MPCSRLQQDATHGDRTQDFTIWSPMLYHYATALPHEAVVIIIFLGHSSSTAVSRKAVSGERKCTKY